MRTALLLAALAASAIALAGCGGDDGSSATDTAADTAETAPATTGTTTATETGPQTVPAKAISIRVVGGVPQGGIQRPTIEKGEKVVLVVRTDAGDGIHLHGYDIEEDVVPGKPVRVRFTASIAGRFELELHPTDTLLAVLEVQP